MKVSVIIPLYNKADYIRDTIDSVLAQAYGDFEIVVVDDGSTDDGPGIVRSINDSRIKLLSQDNAGVSAARNTGIKAANGELVAFLDADDRWEPDKLQKQVDVFKNSPELMWCSCNFNLIHKGRRIRKHHFPEKWFKEKNILSNAFIPLINGYSFWTGTLLIKKEALNQTGLFREDFIRSEDLELVTRVVARFPQVGYIDQQLAEYVILGDNSLTSDMRQFESPDQMCKFPKFLLDHIEDYPAEKRKCLRKYIKKLVDIRMFSALANGYGKSVRKAYKFCYPGFSIRCWLYIFASFVPKKVISLCRSYRIKLLKVLAR